HPVRSVSPEPDRAGASSTPYQASPPERSRRRRRLPVRNLTPRLDRAALREASPHRWLAAAVVLAASVLAVLAKASTAWHTRVVVVAAVAAVPLAGYALRYRKLSRDHRLNRSPQDQQRTSAASAERDG